MLSLFEGVTVTIIVLISVVQGDKGVGRLGNCTWKTVFALMVVVKFICILRFVTAALVEIVLAPKIRIAFRGTLFRLLNWIGKSINKYDPEVIATLQTI